jgi:hypothetical protein
MPKVIYDKILGDPLLYTNMRLQLADQLLCYPKGVLEDAIIQVGESDVSIDFVVLETGEDERAPVTTQNFQETKITTTNFFLKK